MAYATPGGYTVLETRVSPHGSVTLTVVVPDGRKVKVHVPKGEETPDNIERLALEMLDGQRRPNRTR